MKNLVAILCLLTTSAMLRAEPLTIQLVSEVTSIQPGKPFYVGLHLVHAEHYHTYWKFPGIVGVPTDMAWQLPPGWKAEPIEWPAPERVMMFQIKAQGFHDEVLLPMKLTPPKDLEPGAKVTLKGKATWMCCGRECNPGFSDLSVTLPVGTTPSERDERWREQFAKARASMPLPLDDWDASATRKEDRVTLRLAPKRRPDKPQTVPPAGIFFTDDGYINADKDQVFRMDGDALVVELTISTYFTEKPPAELRGILWLSNDAWGKGRIIRAPFEK